MIHGGMAILLPTLPISWFYCIGLTIIIVAHFMYVSRRYVSLRHRNAIIALGELTPTEWRLKTRAGKDFIGILQPDSFVQPYLIVLAFSKRTQKSRLSVAIFPDSLPAGDFRELRVLLARRKNITKK
jgi:hypothetical protein